MGGGEVKTKTYILGVEIVAIAATPGEHTGESHATGAVTWKGRADPQRSRHSATSRANGPANWRIGINSKSTWIRAEGHARLLQGDTKP
jgi:hypothetical protein